MVKYYCDKCKTPIPPEHVKYLFMEFCDSCCEAYRDFCKGCVKGMWEELDPIEWVRRGPPIKRKECI